MFPFNRVTGLPSSARSSAGTSGAVSVSNPSCIASSAEYDFEFSTASCAAARFRLRRLTYERRNAVASFSSFCFMIGSSCRPSITGCAAPAFVPGAIAATSAASSRKNPAEPARLPAGSTYTITGTGDARMLCTISRIESSSPPGVFIRISTAAAWVRSASARPRSRYPAEIG